MIAKTYGAALEGIEGQVIQLEAASEGATPQIHITGLPGDVVKESRERVRVCLRQLGFDFPSGRITVHLSPAHAKKQGSQLDLAIAVAVLGAEGVLPASTREFGYIGELGLDGKLRAVRGAISLIQAMERMPSLRAIFIPRGNAREAALLKSGKAMVVDSLADVIESIEGKRELSPVPTFNVESEAVTASPSLDRVVGQVLGKRALQIALAGRHHLLFIGPPGVGKSLLAHCAADLLPPLQAEERIELTKIYGAFGDKSISRRVFRSPHHTISAAGLLGGGTGGIVPGEISLAHRGVLFLDELPEFRRDVVEGLREPLQTGKIFLHRIGHSHCLPARATLIAAMNPCPCGYGIGGNRRCRCPIERVRSYRKRISGALLDRIDLGVVLSVPQKETVIAEGFSHAEINRSIEVAQGVQFRRHGSLHLNGDVTVDETEPFYRLSEHDANWLEDKAQREGLSYRSRHKLLKVARTLADLAGDEPIRSAHLREAWSLRCPDISALGA